MERTALKLTVKISGLGMHWDGIYTEEDHPTFVKYWNKFGEESYQPFKSFRGDGQSMERVLRHWGAGLYGIFSRGELVARQTSPPDRWLKYLQNGSAFTRKATMEWGTIIVKRKEAAPAKPKGRVMHFASDTDSILKEYELHKKDMQALREPCPVLDTTMSSDLAVFKEVLLNKVYQGFKGQNGLNNFISTEEDILLDIGGNVGMATWFYSTCVGIREGDVYEPSRGCHDTLQDNLKLLKKTSKGNFILHKEAVGKENKNVVFLDRTNCAQGGSSRSAVKEVAPESRAKQALEYKVPQVSFQNALEKHTVVKMDCEGSEIPILLTEWDWKEVRLLVVEISVRKLRMDHPKGDGWKVLEKIFENLKKAGFQYARVEKRFFTPGYWDPESGNRNYMSDGIIWFLRPKGPVEFKESERQLYSHWLQYQRIMETGGEVGNAAKPLVSGGGPVLHPTPEKKCLNVEEQTLMEHVRSFSPAKKKKKQR